MRLYELTLHLSGKLDELEVGNLWNKIKKEIEKNDIKIIREESLEKTALSYPIKKEVYTFFNSLFFEALPETVSKLKKFLDGEKNIIRYLILKHKKEALKTKKSVSQKRTRKETKKTPRKKAQKKSTKKPVIKEKVKKEPKIKLEDIDKSLEKLLEKEL